MKVKMINKQGHVWRFDSCEEARPHIKKDRWNDYHIEEENGEKIRVYDDREIEDQD